MAKDTRDLQRHVTNDLLARRLQKVAHRRFVLGLPTVRRKTLLSFVQQHLLLDLVEHIRCRDVGPDGGIAHHDCLSSTTHPHFHDNRGITLKTSRWPGASAYLKALVASEHTSLKQRGNGIYRIMLRKRDRKSNASATVVQRTRTISWILTDLY